MDSIPKILTITSNGWNLYFYSEFEKIFVNEKSELDEAILKELAPYMDGGFKDFRIQLILKSLPFLTGIFSTDKEIRFYTAKLSQELFIVHNLEIDKENDGKYVEFKKHTGKLATLSSSDFPSQIELNTKKYDLPDFLKDEKYDQLEEANSVLVDRLLINVNKYEPTAFEKVSDFGLSLAADYALIRIHLLKFLAILPSLDFDQSGAEVKRILLESMRRLLEDSRKAKLEEKEGQERPLPNSLVIFFWPVFFLAKLMPPRLLAYLVRASVKFMARRFIAGETIEKAAKSLKGLLRSGRDVTLDQLGELVVSEKEADHYQDEVIKLIRGFSLYVKKGERNSAGINKAHISIKVSALCSDFKPYAFDYTYNLVAPRLKKILIEAKEKDVFINIDAEHYDYRDVVFKVYKKVLLETPELLDFGSTGIVLQSYLRDAYEHFLDILALAKERKILMPIRLVKGAYWDAETIEAQAHGHEAPEFLNKEETDIMCRQLMVKTLQAGKHLQMCLGSHNFSDHCFVEVLREKYYPQAPVIEHQCLHMTYEALSTALANMGYPTRNYVPVGSLIVGMAYLVRRIMENSSQVGVLTIMRSHKNLKGMNTPQAIHKGKKEKKEIEKDPTRFELNRRFFNVAPARLYLEKERIWMERDLHSFAANSLGKEYPNKLALNGEVHSIFSNSDPKIKVGTIQYGNIEDANKAIEQALKSFANGPWANGPWLNRSLALLKAARILLARRNEISALIVYEGGKSIPEAHADVDEAIDFLTFYAREEAKMQRRNKALGARGVISVIAPWNFPIAIPCGMVASALVAGNSIILKSARPTPLIAQLLIDVLHEAGVPTDALIHLPGKGSEVGEVLVGNSDIAGIVFTGSKEVGMHMAHKAGKRILENVSLKHPVPAKIITEMGGKNAIIVTANAELDETVAGILYSSFGHSGQKCSAASRILVDIRIKDKLIARLKQAALDIKVGAAYDFSSTMNPIINSSEKERLRRDAEAATIEASRFNGKVIIDRSREDLPGQCIGPVIIELPSSRVLNQDSYAYKELFGPIIHVIGYEGLDEALEIYNGTEYALTGGVFSQSQDDIDYLTAKMQTGNIYINRAITGARVGIEPFGGFKLSGTGPKAGGTGYVPTFHVSPLNLPRETENIQQVPANGEGSSYDFDLCDPYSGSLRDHRKIFGKGMQKLIGHFENFFQGIYGDQKEILIDFKKWAYKDLNTYLKSEHMNQEIPGQLSYNDFTQKEERIIIIAFEPRAYFSSMMEFVTALSMGIGVTVLARNQKAFDWWNQMKSIFGTFFREGNFDVYFPTEDLCAKALKEPKVRTVIVDGGEKQIGEVLDVIYDENYNEKFMKHVLTPLDSPDVGDFERLVQQFIFIRSFAVNIMRHGAPMELD
ncbi:MAG: aldehyde dehydrogenase family protein [Deltaproteobacteria bacterium]|nr:MAG: aldehyde dehydrogenase family protein [Deltaproteobacteria bacterium]